MNALYNWKDPNMNSPIADIPSKVLLIFGPNERANENKIIVPIVNEIIAK